MDLLPALSSILSSQPGIANAYLFGSRAKGRERPDSDIDIAVDWASNLEADGKAAAENDLRAAFADALGELGERLDLVDLRAAGSTLGFRIIRDGKLILCRDRRAKVNLEASIARRYDDEAGYRQLFRQAAIAAGLRLEAGVHGRR